MLYYIGVDSVPGKYICQDSVCVCHPKMFYYTWVDCVPGKYRKFPKYSDTQKIVVITLKFELCGSIIE